MIRRIAQCALSSAVVFSLIGILGMPVAAATGDIGIWVDQDGNQSPGTSFASFAFEGTGSEVRNDGEYTYNAGTNDVTVSAGGNYLVLYYLHNEDTSGNRGNIEGRVTVNGSAVAGSYGAGYKRDGNNQQIHVRGHALVLNVSANDEIGIEWRRDSGASIGASVAGVSELMIVHLPDDDDVAYGHYSASGIDAMGGTTWSGMPFDTLVRETDSSVIEGDLAGGAGTSYIGVAGHIGEDGGDGFLPTWFGATPLSGGIISLLADEDQVVDTERNHTTEDLSYWIFNDGSGGDIRNSGNTIIGEYGIAASVGSSFETVTLQNTYTDPVVIGTHNLVSASDIPAVVRVDAVGSTSFDVKLQNPSGSTPTSADVHYIVIESGLHTLHGGDQVEAGIVSSSTALSTSFPGTMETISLTGSFTDIATFVQVHDNNETAWMQGWSSDGTQTGTPTPSNFSIGRHTGQDSGSRAATDLGWVAIERGTGSMDSVDWEAGITSDTIQGPDDSPPYTYSITFPSVSDPGEIILKPGNTRFLVLYGVSLDVGGRTQRISRARANSSAIEGTHGYTYMRDSSNSLGALVGMFIFETDSGGNDRIAVQVQRGNADVDGSGGLQSGNSGIFVMELPSSAEVFASYDQTGGQDIGGVASVDLNLMRTVAFNDAASFTQENTTSIQIEQDMDMLSSIACLVERQDTSGTRGSVSARFEIEGINQARGEHGFYLRGDQGSQDTYNASLNNASIFSVSSGDSIQVESFDDGDNGSDDQTVGNACGISALNLDSLVVSGGNNTPVVSAVSIDSGAATVVLNEGTTKDVVCAGTVTDADGYADITSVEAILYRTGNGTGGADDPNNKYTESGDSECVPSGGAGTSENYTCTFEVLYYADATDVGSDYAADNWTCGMTATDTSTSSATVTDTIEMGSLLALGVSSQIDYGTLLPNTDTGASNQQITITNTGNRAIDPEISGVDMTSGSDTLTVGNQEYSATTFTYGVGTDLTTTPTTLNLALPQQTSATVTDDVYWGIGIPNGQPSGVYTGTVVLTAVTEL